jgi:hypothetical protein
MARTTICAESPNVVVAEFLNLHIAKCLVLEGDTADLVQASLNRFIVSSNFRLVQHQ